MILLDSIRRGRQIFQNDVSYASQLKPASEAVLLMIYSPSKYVASQARQILSEVLMQNVETMEEIFDTLRTSTTARDKFDVVDLQTVINLIGLACLLGLPKYQSYFINRWDVTKTLTTLIGWCSDDDVRVEKPGIDLDLNSRSGYTCCWLDTKDWEGRDILLFFNLWVMAELIRLFKNHGSLELGGFDAQNLVLKLREICGSNYSPGARCYAAYIMSYFGFYGFPSRLGDRIRKALYGKDYADVQLKLSSGEIVEVHSVILTVRCPSMFPSNEKICYGSAGGQDTDQLCTKFKREVRVSSRVNCQTLMKLLEFGYTGFVEVDGDLVKQLKIIAKGCNFHSLSHMLGKKHPKWGSTIPSCDFTLALGPAGHNFS
ncbi:hypothetical protein GIB67_009229 [Kingdonia uniflora]|uniref:BTB domain-containing protein n=1 Tax=Kingdonia uniflora TaxID=39325 RepID=A0A7J7N2T4_9MAGN|nr:hypothetical protein GIB67_009229 [Kingdonia uniflora]